MSRERPRQRRVLTDVFSVLALLWAVGCGEDAPAPAPSDAPVADSKLDRPDAGEDRAVDLSSDTADTAAHGPETSDMRAVDAMDQGAPDQGPVDRGGQDTAGSDVPGPTPGACARAAPDRPGVNGRPAYLDLVVNGAGFESHEGQRVHVLARDYQSQLSLGYGSAMVAQGKFVLRFPRGYAMFSYQPMFFYVDLDGNGACDPAVDHLGSFLTNGYTGSDPFELGLSHEQHAHDSSRPRADASVCATLNACR